MARQLPVLRPDRKRRFSWRVDDAPRSGLTDAYYYLIAASWPRLLGVFFGSYSLLIGIFALTYFPVLHDVEGAVPGSVTDAFFFSVHTFSTIGFGSMYPKAVWVHVLVYLESFAGLVFVALGTGIVFAKFAKPSAQICFSDVAVIYRRNGKWTLSARLANTRRSEVLNGVLHASALVEDVTSEGEVVMRNVPLKLSRNTIPLFTLGLTLFHDIDESSLLWPLVNGSDAEEMGLHMLIMTFSGTDSTLLQTVQARCWYSPRELLFNHRFEDMIDSDVQTGERILKFANLNTTVAQDAVAADKV